MLLSGLARVHYVTVHCWPGECPAVQVLGMQPIRLYRRAENWPRPVFAEQTQRGEEKNEKVVQTKRSTLFETHFKGISNPNFESLEHSLK